MVKQRCYLRLGPHTKVLGHRAGSEEDGSHAVRDLFRDTGALRGRGPSSPPGHQDVEVTARGRGVAQITDRDCPH
jgi:hypothetical protein